MEEFNRLTIYRSSAGSGKTYTLVKEYLRIALHEPRNFRYILAITFTNKATDEMKSRIVKTLVEFTEGKNENLRNILIEELHITSQQFNLRATELLSLILHNYSDFSVCTIDSFFSRIMRSLAKEMHMPIQFDTEINTDMVLGIITENVLQEAGKDKELTRWLEEFILSKMEDEKGWRIENEIKQIAFDLLDDDLAESFEQGKKISHQFVEKLKSIKYNYESEMYSFGKEFLKLLDDYSLSVVDFSFGKAGVAGFFEKLHKKNFDVTIGVRVRDAANDVQKWAAKKSPEYSRIEGLAGPMFQPLLAKTIAFHEKNQAAYITANEVLSKIYIAGIMYKLEEKLKEYREENELFLISDTGRILKKFLAATDSIFIYEKTGNRYHHFLIDEFQDTSTTQWKNTVPLIENSLGSGSSVLIVGDAKQSIYRWRGGNMHLLLEGIQNDLKQFAAITETKDLQTNFRSRKEIIDFNNHFFKSSVKVIRDSGMFEGNLDILDKAYNMNGITQFPKSETHTGGYVECLMFKKDKIPQEGEPAIKKETYLKELVKTINKILEDGFELKDIAILVRKNDDGSSIADYLFKNGFDKIISSESLLIQKSAKINLLISLLRFCYDHNDFISRTAILNDYFRLRNEIHTGPHRYFEKAHSDEAFFNLLPAEFKSNLDKIKKLPLYELTEQLSSIFGLQNKPDAYVQRFLDVIIEQPKLTKKATSTVSTFLEWWDENGPTISVITPTGENAIQVLSIHKSKGLQFPVVIIPFADWDLKPKPSSTLWISSDISPYNEYPALPVSITKRLEHSYFKEQYYEECNHTLADNLNLLYVALTRPEERLYIFCPQQSGDSISRASDLVQSVLESDEFLNTKIRPEEQKRLFSYGDEHSKKTIVDSVAGKENSIDNPSITTIDSFNSNPWQHKLALAVNKNKISINDEEGVLAKNDYGNLIHQLFEKIIHENDAAPAIKYFVENGLLENEQEVTNTVRNVLDICRDKKWFHGEYDIRTESEILIPGGEVLRLDRVMIKNNKAVVLDYKSGDADKMHERQVQQYCSVLKNSGFESAEGFLLYLKENRLVKVT